MLVFENIKPGTHLKDIDPAAETLKALTWRAGSEIAVLGEKRDPTLVWHICDLRIAHDQYDAAQITALAHEVMMADVQECGDKFLGWEKDPLGETLRAIEDIPKVKVFVEGYANFLRDMDYGEKLNFKTAIETLRGLADQFQQLPS